MKKARKYILITLPVLLVGISAWYIGSSFLHTPADKKAAETDSVETTPAVPEKIVFGIPAGGLNQKEYIVKSGDNVSSILNKHGVPMATIEKLLSAAGDKIDLTRIVAGKKFTFFFDGNEEGKMPLWIVYEPSAMKYVKISTSGNMETEIVEQQLNEQEGTLGAIIHYSLYQSVYDKGKDINLAYKIAEIFKWSIDFFALQKGDKFKVVYDEKVTDSGHVHSTGDIKAAWFRHGGKDYYAIRFAQGDKIGYYDLDGMSMKTRFLQAPLEFTRISSGFSLSRYHPILKRRTPHLGIDYAAPMGTPIVAVADGVVLECAFKGGNGNYVKLKHDDVYSTQYLHMSKFGPGIKKGVSVQQGQVIGYVGSTGLSTGPHLCYRFWKNGKQINPTDEISQATEPLQKEYLDAFNKVRDIMVKQLEAVGYREDFRSKAIDGLKKISAI